MRSVFELHLRSTSLRGPRAPSDGDASLQPSPGERRLRLLRAVLGENHTSQSPPPIDPPLELGHT
jgi:hypothetical protein